MFRKDKVVSAFILSNNFKYLAKIGELPPFFDDSHIRKNFHEQK